MDNLLEELRGYLNKKPSAEYFGCIFQVLDTIFVRYGSDEATMAVQYAEQHLQHWDSRLREFSSYTGYVPQFGPHWLLVHHVDFTDTTLGNIGVQALASCPHMTNLRTLDLWANGICNAGAEALAKSPFLQKLERLDLRMNNIGLPGFLALANASDMPSLKKLNLERNSAEPDNETMQAFISSPLFQQLESLGLPLFSSPNSALITFVQSPMVQKLSIWTIREHLSESVRTAILESPYVEEYLKLPYRGLTTAS